MKTLIKSQRIILEGEGEEAHLHIFAKPVDCDREFERLKRAQKRDQT